MAADPHDGHVFVADQSNARVVELNALGEFIKTWGWDVVQSGSDNSGTGFEICTPSKGDTCKAGTEGSGAGQFSAISMGVALDSAGNVYVTDRGFLGSPSLRVQKFDPKGNFKLMFGGEVNKTKTEEVGSTEAERNLCPVDPGDECKAGTLGTGNGQFGEWGIGDFIAIDDKGTASLADDKVYVGDQNRIQVFDTAGQYKESLPLPGETVQSLATDKAGSLYAIYSGEPDVRKLTSSGEELEAPRFAVPFPPGASATAVDAAGNVFAFSSGSILEFDSAGNPITSFGSGEFAGSTGLATNLCPGSESPGNLYATNLSESEAFVRSYGTEPIGCFKARTAEAKPIGEQGATLNGTVNPSGLAVTECFFEYGKTTAYEFPPVPCEDPGAGEIGTGTVPVPVHAAVSNLEKGTVYHFRLIAKIGGETETGADEEFKTLGPPVISAERATKVAFTSTTLKASVNPEGFTTAYRFQYTTQAAFEEHGFTGAKSTSPVNVGSAGDRSEHPASAELEGLAPGTAYRWRVVAVNSSGQSESLDHPLITYRTPVPAPDSCANAALRTEASAQLPDCRAYEMVSPVDKNGGDIVSNLSGFGNPGGYVQATADGGKLTYGVAFAAFAGEPASFFFNQYLADRGGGGWSNEGIHPPVPGHLCCESLNLGLTREFSAFSPDLCDAWIYDPQGPPLLADGQQGYPNLYRRQNCGAGTGSLEALTPSPPTLPSGTEKGYVNPFAVQGLSEGARHIFFVARAKLIDEAAESFNGQVYDRFEGENHLVSVLPGGAPDKTPTSVGSGSAGSPFAGAGNLDNAVAEDGSRVYWTSGISNPTTGVGKIYVRSHPEQGRVEGEECDPAGTKACTRSVSAGPNAFYWTAANDGSKALYSEGEDLFEYDLEKAENEEPPSRLIAHHVNGVAGASEELSRIYFVSTDALNGEAEGEEAGQPNLYLGEGEEFTFIGALAESDMGVAEPGAKNVAYNIVGGHYERPTRVTPDGTHIAFESRAPLTGYDSSGGTGGKPAVEVFSYEAGGEVVCISCNPSGAAPSGVRELRLPYLAAFETSAALQTKVPAAAWIPTWEHKLHASNVLSADGNRLFFNSNDALLPRDANGAPDVYEWEAAGTGGCSTAGANYFAKNGGCLFLISSGEDSRESEFWEATPDGSNVFFTTAASLLPQDPGSIDLYDARVNGGFPQPTPRAECEGEACQSPPPPPAFPTPSSGSYNGPPNQKPNKGCPKGKKKVQKKGKTHCEKKHKKNKKNKSKGKKNREANNNRRARR